MDGEEQGCAPIILCLIGIAVTILILVLIGDRDETQSSSTQPFEGGMAKDIAIIKQTLAKGSGQAVVGTWTSWQTFEATAYTNHDPGCDNITKTGHELCPASRVVAVDPVVIPMGSTVEVQGFGIFYAMDVGGSIKGNKVDIFQWASTDNRTAAFQFGRRNVEVRWKVREKE